VRGRGRISVACEAPGWTEIRWTGVQVGTGDAVGKGDGEVSASDEVGAGDDEVSAGDGARRQISAVMGPLMSRLSVVLAGVVQ
jgi:hypothetical protein